MKAIWRIALVTLFVLAPGYFVYARRFQLAAKIWHWRYGSFAIVSGYQIRVPDGWLVTSQTDEDLNLVATRTVEHGTVFANIVVGTVRPRSSKPRDLAPWRLSQEQFLRSKGVKDIDERTLHFDGETVQCMGENVARDVWRLPNATLFTLGCMSTSPLIFMFVGQKSEVPQFEDVVSGIRKR
jgi:hypothetical protein